MILKDQNYNSSAGDFTKQDNNTGSGRGGARRNLMNTGICYIVGAGENYGLDFVLKKEDFVIAADAGFRHLQDRGESHQI